MLSKELEFTLNLAFKEAQEKKHEFITVEHLLLALLDNPAAADVLRACGANMDELRNELTQFIDSNTPELAVEDIRDVQPTLGFQRVMQRTLFHVQAAGKDEATGANVLVAIFTERESHAAYYLQQQDMTRYDAVNFISHGVAKDPAYSEHVPLQGAGDLADDVTPEEKKETATSAPATTPRRSTAGAAPRATHAVPVFAASRAGHF